MAHFLFGKPSKGNFRQLQTGQFLIELLIAMAIMGLLLPVLLGGLVIGRDSLPDLQQKSQARQVLQSTTEIMRVIRERGWEFVATNGTFHPVADGNTWQLATGSENIGAITRSIIVQPVRRLADGQIVESGGSIDPSAKRITIRLTWSEPSSGTLENTVFMTRYLDNITQTDTTVPDFEAGEHTGTTTISTSGEDGQVILGSGGSGGWCSPFESQVGEIDLPKSGVANAIYALPGRAFVGTGENASGVSFAEVSITTDQEVPTANITATFDGYKTNDIFGEIGFAYLATDTKSEEVVMINTLTQTKSGYYNAPGSNNGQAVAVQGTIGYVATSNNKLHNFNLTEKTGSRSSIDLDGESLSGLGTKVRVQGDYAYIAIGSGTNELEIVDISDANNLTWISRTSLGSKPARDVIINSSGTRAFVVTQYSATEPEIYAVDISDKSGSRPVLGTFDTGLMDPKGATLVPGNRLIVVGHGGMEYQVITVNDTGTAVGMSQCGGLDLDLNINGVASVYETDGDAFSYIITSSADKEFKMLEGGPGGQFSQSGTFESRTLDVGYETAFNYVIATKLIPPQTSLVFQVAVAKAVNNSCDDAVFSFVGPGGDPGAFYDVEGPIPLDDDGLGFENPGRCFRYKTYFETTDSSQSPVLESLQVNYSP